MHVLAALLPSLVLADASAKILDAGTALQDGQLIIEALTSEPVARHDVRTKLTAQGLALYIEGAAVESGRRSFGAPGQRQIGVFPRSTYTKLQVPLAAGVACAGPVAVTLVENRVRASITCNAAAAPIAGLVGQHSGVGQVATPPAPPPPPPSPPPVGLPSLRAGAAAAELAAPAPLTAAPPVTRAAAPAPAALPTPAPAPTGARPTPAETAAPAPVLEARPPLPRSEERASRPSSLRPAPAPPSGVPFGWILSVVVLAGVSILLLWRQRRRTGGGMIRIVETASLGPRRALVVAEVNGDRLILGTSEAGITLLTPLPPGLGGTGTSEEVEPAPEDIIEEELPPEGEKGMLSRLFRRTRERAAVASEDDEGPSTMAEDFKDLLDDTMEDEELRRRLQSGRGGQVK